MLPSQPQEPSASAVPPAEFLPGDSEPKTKIMKKRTVLVQCPVPKHWQAPHGGVDRLLFNALCIMAFGHAGLDPIWASIKLWEKGVEDIWVEETRQTCDRLSTMSVVAGLLLATSAAFMTTGPPKANMIDYTLRGPYICIVGAFGLLIGGVLVASVVLLVKSKVGPHWSETVFYANRFHVYCTLMILSYPSVSIGTATLLLIFGLLSAVWCSDDPGLQGACAVLLFVPVSMAGLFAFSCAIASARSGSQDRRSCLLPEEARHP